MDWLAFFLGAASGVIACVFTVLIILLVLIYWVHRIDQNETIF